MIIDAHSHYLTKKFADSSPFYNEAWYNFDLRREKRVNTGLEIKEILSYPLGGILEKLPIQTVPEEIMEFNDTIAGNVKDDSGIYGLAALYPPVGSKLYLPEMERAINELNLCGFSISSSYDGVYLDNEMFWPMFEKSIELNKPIFVHPATTKTIGHQQLGEYHLLPILGFVFDTTLSLVRLILSETLQRFKEARIVFSHLGGTFPFLMSRVAALGALFFPNLDLSSIKKDLKNVYFDTCTYDTGVLEFAIKTFGADKILLGTDFPAIGSHIPFVNSINSLGISESEKEMILKGNFARVMGM